MKNESAFRTTGMGCRLCLRPHRWLSAPIVIGSTFSRIGFGGVFLITTVVLVAGALAVWASELLNTYS